MTSPTTLSRLSSRAFEDLWDERSDVPLEVSGRLPAGLVGTLYRVVPTAFDWPKGSFHHWFDGHGQIHALRLQQSGQVRYTNRFVETKALAKSRRSGKAGSSFGTRSGLGAPGSTANTNVLELGDRLLALQEGSPPYALKPDTLETVGQDDLGCLGRGEGLSAHPHWDPRRKATVAANLVYGREAIARVRTLDARGSSLGSFDMALPYTPVLLHDFGLSARHVAVPVFPQTVQPLKVLMGLESLAEGSRWEPERGAFVLVADRDGGSRRRHELPAMYAFHMVNCFDEGDTVVLDMIGYATGEAVKQIGAVRTEGTEGLEPGTLQRLRLVADGRTEIERLSEAVAEFPRLDPRRQGLKHRHSFFVTSRAEGPGAMRAPWGAIARLDHEARTTARWLAPDGHIVGEPVPVVKEGAGESDAAVWLLTMVYDPAIHRSALVVLDGEALEAGPVATVHLPHHLPLGFHGNFHRG